MYIIKNRLSFRSKAAFLLVLPVALAACQTTVNTRWASNQDSAEAWQTTMTTIPIDVHGAIPGDTTVQTATLVNGGTTMAAFDAAHAGQASLERSRRIELYVDTDKLPASNSYCAAEPSLESVQNAKGGAEVVGALCDGPRLVATEVVHLDSRNADIARVPQGIDMFKSKLLDGLVAATNQTPPY
jgi:hypothetical protein